MLSRKNAQPNLELKKPNFLEFLEMETTLFENRFLRNRCRTKLVDALYLITIEKSKNDKTKIVLLN